MSLRLAMNLTILESHLQNCRSHRTLRQIHTQMLISGYINDTYAASRILDFTTRSSYIPLDYSIQFLHHLRCPNGFSWNRVMKAAVTRDSPHLTLNIYKSMLLSSDGGDGGSLIFDNYTYPILLQACSVRGEERQGRQIHTHVLELGFGSDVYVVNTLMNLYSLCENVKDARRLFDESPLLDTVSWNTMLAAYVDAGHVEEATCVYNEMPVRSTIASNSLIALFGRKNLVDEARRLFDRMPVKDMVSWTTIISCYEQNKKYEKALEMFRMMNSEDIPVDEVALISALTACVRLAGSMEGRTIHGLAVRTVSVSYVNLQNSLIYMYSSFGDVAAARRLFDGANLLDQISWNCMISGYAQHDQHQETLTLFHEMMRQRHHGSVKPDEGVLVSVITACARLSSLEQGRLIHSYIKQMRYEPNSILGTTLVDMYMKCGCVEDAMEMFDEMEHKGASTWNALIAGLAMNGLVGESLAKFSEMTRHGGVVVPNEITFVAVLGACRHVGLVDEGRKLFDSMKEIHKIEPNVKHYSCMVDLLGRAGFLREAEDLIETMPMAPDVATWGALLGACRKHGESEMGERIGRRLVELEPEHDGFRVLLSNIYACRGKWDNAMEMRDKMKQQSVVKIPGCSSLIQANDE